MTTVLERDPGTRSRRRRARRLRRRALTLLVAVAVAAGVGYGAQQLISRDQAPAPPAGGSDEQATMLVAMTIAGEPSQQADALTVFGVDPDGAHPVVMFVPIDIVTEIPGQGSAQIGKAMTFGRLSLVETSVENMAGFVIDDTVGIDDAALGALIDRLGGIEVSIAEELYETAANGTRELVFPLGEQHLDGAAAITYLTYRSEGQPDLDRFPRAQKVWEALFAAAAANPEGLQGATGALAGSVLGADGAEGFLAMLARFAAAESSGFEVLPPEALASGGQEPVFQVDEEALGAVIDRAFAASVPPQGIGTGVRVEIRNGNGRPEIGEQVAALIVPVGMKVVVSGNADSFGYASTRIVVYGDDEASIALGRRVRELLGVGRVEVGTRGQTVADVTIVVGRDFVEGKA